MSLFFEALSQFFSQYVVALVVLIIAIVIFIWNIATRFQSMADKVDTINTLPCSHHDLRLNSHDTQIADTRALLSKMEGKLDILVQNSIEKGNQKIRTKSSSTFSAKNSPRKLNENGISLLHDCGGAEVLNSNMLFFIEKIEQLQPKTALDVEDFALAVLRAHTNDDIFIPIKNWVYNAPSRKIKNQDGTTIMQDVDMDDVIFVMSLPLRDKYLEQHPQITQ